MKTAFRNLDFSLLSIGDVSAHRYNIDKPSHRDFFFEIYSIRKLVRVSLSSMLDFLNSILRKHPPHRV